MKVWTSQPERCSLPVYQQLETVTLHCVNEKDSLLQTLQLHLCIVIVCKALQLMDLSFVMRKADELALELCMQLVAKNIIVHNL